MTVQAGDAIAERFFEAKAEAEARAGHELLFGWSCEDCGPGYVFGTSDGLWWHRFNLHGDGATARLALVELGRG